MADKATMEQSLREIDGNIVKVARELADAIDAGADWKGIDVTVGFLETLMRRRRVILSEYARAGGRVKELNTFGAAVAPEPAAGATGSAGAGAHVERETTCR